MNFFAACAAYTVFHIWVQAYFPAIAAFSANAIFKMMVISDFSRFLFGVSGVYCAAFTFFLYGHYAYGIMVVFVQLDISRYICQLKESSLIKVMNNITAAGAFIMPLLPELLIPVMNCFAADQAFAAIRLAEIMIAIQNIRIRHGKRRYAFRCMRLRFDMYMRIRYNNAAYD